MTYLKLRDSMKDFTVFSVRDIRRVDPAFHRRRLNEWQDKGYIMKVVKGFYVFADRPLDEWDLFEIANRIYRPSYISLESALAHYQLIPESVYGVTSISTRRSYHFASGLADFRFRTVRPQLFFGYDLAPVGGRRVKIARPEKAVLDFLYLNPRLQSEPDFESLRINGQQFRSLVDDRRLRTALGRFTQKTLLNRVDRLLGYLRKGG